MKSFSRFSEVSLPSERSSSARTFVLTNNIGGAIFPFRPDSVIFDKCPKRVSHCFIPISQPNCKSILLRSAFVFKKVASQLPKKPIRPPIRAASRVPHIAIRCASIIASFSFMYIILSFEFSWLLRFNYLSQPIPSESPSKKCGSSPITLKFLYSISAQTSLGGGG